MTCRSATELVRTPGDAWLAAPGIVMWRVGGIDGASLWGRIASPQIDVAFGVARAHADAATGRTFDLVSDLTAVTSFEDAAYLRMAMHLAELLPRIEERVRSHAVIVPDGLLRAAVAGFLHLHSRHPWRLAVALGDVVDPSVAARIAAIVEPRRHDDLVGALRAHLVSDSLTDAAKALGVAPRTLQRALRAAGTTFRAVIEDGRIAAACRLLDESDLKVEAIAREVGFRSLSGFVRSFRRVCGCSPHERRVRLSS